MKFDTVKELRHRFNCLYEIDYEAGHIGLISEMNAVKEKVIYIMEKIMGGGEQDV